MDSKREHTVQEIILEIILIIFPKNKVAQLILCLMKRDMLINTFEKLTQTSSKN